MSMHHETTNDELAVIINKGFQNVQDQLNGMTERFDGMDRKLEGMDRNIGKLDGRVNLLVNTLEKKQVITFAEKEVILT